MGRVNPAVFPVPVCAANTSLPSKIGGIAFLHWRRGCIPFADGF
jgi:hypothetical protein